MIPNDPIMLMSYLNTQLRDHYASLSELVEGLDISEEEIVVKLDKAGFVYNQDLNKFVGK
ncbi:MAG: DUF4250 domain-containing protein [Erysipelotrichaceae bacterium]|nr:DUF4250 domain-containing protein [Erysipelotrichaceae bacterium]